MTLIKHFFPLLVTGYLTLVTFPTAQDISSDFFPSNYLQFSHDYGVNWPTNSSFKPYQWDDLNEAIPDDSGQFPTQWMVDDLKSSGIQRIINSENVEDKLQCNAWLGTLLQFSDGEGAKFQNGSATLYGYFHFN